MQLNADEKVVLDNDLVVIKLLEKLLKDKVINVATYNRAIKEVKCNGNSNK